jgi:NAD+ synthase
MIEKWQVNSIVDFLRNHLQQTKKECYILGLSGGIDSTLVLALTTLAVGADKIKTYSLPYFEDLETTNKAYEIATYFKVWKMKMNIKPIVDMYNVNASYRLGNIMARTRMTILYDQAMSYNGLVLNTCNLSEDMVGYATKYGDAAGDIAPIAHLTKKEIYEMAEALLIPEQYINRKPSAELWQGQTDEDELGFTYDELDAVIELYKRENVFLGVVYHYNMYDWMDYWDKTNHKRPVLSEIWNSIRNKNISAQHKLNHMPSLIHNVMG